MLRTPLALAFQQHQEFVHHVARLLLALVRRVRLSEVQAVLLKLPESVVVGGGLDDATVEGVSIDFQNAPSPLVTNEEVRLQLLSRRHTGRAQDGGGAREEEDIAPLQFPVN